MKIPPVTKHTIDALTQFIRMESFAGILLMIACVLALIMANSPISGVYQQLIDLKFTVGFENAKLSKPLLLWINDGMMALFFLLIGLELKREILRGQLSRPSQVMLPGIAAIGGIAIPALIFVYFNYEDKISLHGWAIPTATDIAFALGALALLSKRVPQSVKIFLMALAIFDDLAAIIIIAIFYTSDLSALSLALAGWTIVLLVILNRFNVIHLPLYLFVGLILWIFVLNSGVHATLSGVILAFMVPLHSKEHPHYSPLEELESKLHMWVTYFILPLFAFANSGINLSHVNMETLLSPLTLGIALGLFLGKQIGVFGFSYIFIKCKLAALPEKTNLYHIYGVSILAGVGFTMSLFISSLAFGPTALDYSTLSRLGIFIGSILSIIGGLLVLRFCPQSSE